MQIFSISDLHLDVNNKKPMDIFGPVWHEYLDKIEKDWQEKVSDEDVVILAGDYSWAMKLDEVVPDFEFIKNLKGHKIIIRGNHDYWWSSLSKVRTLLPEKTYALQNDAIKLGEYIFCGNRGWLIPEGKLDTEENQKIYAREVIRAELSLKSAKKLQTNDEKIIFITHYPPFNNKIEPSEYTRLLEEYGVDSVIFGHLHGYVNPKMLYNEINGVKYYLTSCDAVKNRLVEIK
ncbi:MAG: serine/threonine protein phosphatase [Clostridiales bacterium]|nr:serine/threonine protein phosphatase [Clostridiales bacterium]